VPLATTLNEAVCPAETVAGKGWVVTAGTEPTESVAALLATVPAELVTLQRN